MGFLDRIFGKKPKTVNSREPLAVSRELEAQKLEAVPGAMTASSGGKVLYNMLTPHMQQFLGRCVGAIKKEGIKAKGTGQFSILIGEDQQKELFLKNYYQPTDDPSRIEAVVKDAKKMA